MRPSRWAGLSMALTGQIMGRVLCAWHRLPFNFYGSRVGNGFVFAPGSVAYFHRHWLRIGPALFALATLAYGFHLYVVPALEQADLDNANLAVSVLPLAVILGFLVRTDVVPRRWAALSDLAGRIA